MEKNLAPAPAAYIYIPIRTNIDPDSVADALSESLTPVSGGTQWGYWTTQTTLEGAGVANVTPGGLYLNGLRTYGQKSILMNRNNEVNSWAISGVATEGALDSLTFNFHTPIPMNTMRRFVFTMQVKDRGGAPYSFTDKLLNGQGMVILEDKNGKYATRNISFSISDAMGSFITYQFLPSDFTTDGTFDWIDVKAWHFVVFYRNLWGDWYTHPGYDMWLDAPFVLLMPGQKTLTANQQYAVSPGEYIISPTDVDFVRWEDNSPKDKLFTVTYQQDLQWLYTVQVILAMELETVL
jgi:hypothetical protein